MTVETFGACPHCGLPQIKLYSQRIGCTIHGPQHGPVEGDEVEGKGDSPGHAFRGNQYSGGNGGSAHEHESVPTDLAAHVADQHGGGDGKDHGIQHAIGMTGAELHAAPLNHIADIIQKNWPKVNFAAKPYLQAMSSMDKIGDRYGMDSGKSVVAYFLSNASSWHGPAATVIRQELKDRMKGAAW